MKNNQSSENSRHTIRLLKVLSKRSKFGCIYSIQNDAINLELSDKVFRFSLRSLVQAI